MGLFDFLRKKESDVMVPKQCQSEIPADVAVMIDQVDWSGVGTAYGDAENTVPFYLKNLFCSDEAIAQGATHQLWCSLCHQHAFISDAALPAYAVLKVGLLRLNDDLKTEILDIFTGFASCLSNEYYTVPNELDEWEKQLQAKMLADREIFNQLALNEDIVIAGFAKRICDYLDNTKR
jgi:hypothetical protein